jgi:hypothetical protein
VGLVRQLVGEAGVGHSGVDPGWDADVDSYTRKKVEQLLTLIVGEIAGQALFLFDGDGERLPEELATVGREVQRPGATIVAVLAALEQPACFE